MSCYRCFSYCLGFLLHTVVLIYSVNSHAYTVFRPGNPSGQPIIDYPVFESIDATCGWYASNGYGPTCTAASDGSSQCKYNGTSGSCGTPIAMTIPNCNFVNSDTGQCSEQPIPDRNCEPMDPAGEIPSACYPPPPCSDYDSCFNFAWDNNPDCQGAETYNFTYVDSSNFTLSCGVPSDPLTPVDPALYDPANDPTDPSSPESSDGIGGAGGGNNGDSTTPSPGSGSGTPPTPTDPTNDPSAQPIDDSRIIEALNKQLNLLDDRLSSIDRNLASVDDNINEAINDQTQATVRALNNIGQTLSNPNLGNGQNIENAIIENGRHLDQIEYNTSKTGNILEQMVNTDDLRTVDPDAPGRQLDQPGGSFEGVFDRIGAAPIMQDFSNISALIQVPASTCPPFNIDLTGTLIGANLSTTTHCHVFESARSVLETLFSIIWIIVAFRIVAGA